MSDITQLSSTTASHAADIQQQTGQRCCATSVRHNPVVQYCRPSSLRQTSSVSCDVLMTSMYGITCAVLPNKPITTKGSDHIEAGMSVVDHQLAVVMTDSTHIHHSSDLGMSDKSTYCRCSKFNTRRDNCVVQSSSISTPRKRSTTTCKQHTTPQKPHKATQNYMPCIHSWRHMDASSMPVTNLRGSCTPGTNSQVSYKPLTTCNRPSLQTWYHFYWRLRIRRHVHNYQPCSCIYHSYVTCSGSCTVGAICQPTSVNIFSDNVQTPTAADMVPLGGAVSSSLHVPQLPNLQWQLYGQHHQLNSHLLLLPQLCNLHWQRHTWGQLPTCESQTAD
jgi:hypothetical protein